MFVKNVLIEKKEIKMQTTKILVQKPEIKLSEDNKAKKSKRKYDAKI